jgi:hypothetical protein
LPGTDQIPVELIKIGGTKFHWKLLFLEYERTGTPVEGTYDFTTPRPYELPYSYIPKSFASYIITRCGIIPQAWLQWLISYHETECRWERISVLRHILPSSGSSAYRFPHLPCCYYWLCWMYVQCLMFMPSCNK